MKPLEKILRDDFFQTFFEVWAGHLKLGHHPSLLVNLFLEQLRDPSPEASPTRTMCTLFTNIMAIRGWEELREELMEILPDLVPDTKPFKKEEAKKFYEQFKSLVIGHIEDYYRGYESQGDPSFVSPEK